MVTKASVHKAGHELGDLLVLVIDETPNSQQLTEFTTQGFEAFRALASVGIPKDNREAIARNLVEALLNRVNEKFRPLPEG